MTEVSAWARVKAQRNLRLHRRVRLNRVFQSKVRAVMGTLPKADFAHTPAYGSVV